MDLGRFGLGLKTASLSQCKTLTVVAKQGKSLLAAQWDLDHIVETGDWTLRCEEQNWTTTILKHMRGI